MCLGVPGQITRILDGPGLVMASVECAGAIRQCCLAYLPEATVGDYVIMHLGFAVALVDEEAALESLAVYRDLGLSGDGTQ